MGKTRNPNRDPDAPHFTRRSDGARFDFQILLDEHREGVDLVAYDFELVLPGEQHPPWIRYDLNPPAHDNEEDGLRSHLHLGTDDDGMTVPAPVMSPVEILDLFLHGVHRTGRIRRLGR